MSGQLSRQCVPAFAVLLVVAISAGPAVGQITLSEDIESGALNVPASVVDGINITLEPQKHTGDYGTNRWHWVYFRASGVSGLTPKFRIPIAGGIPFPEHRWVYSYDQVNWEFLDNGILTDTDYLLSDSDPFTGDDVYIAVMLPYTVPRTDAMVASIKDNPYVHPTVSADANLVIGHTPGTAGGDANGLPYYDFRGRVVPSQNLYGFMITDAAATRPKTKIGVMVGNHAGEHNPHYAVEGFVQMLISDDPRMAHLRRITEFYFYPQVDPEGRWQGHYRTGPINPTVDHNRIWDNPVGNPEVQIVEAAMQADTGGTVEYFFDFHGMWRPRTELASSPPMYNSDFPAHLLHYVDPVVLNVNWDVRFGHVWAESAGGLNATYAATPEIGSVPLWKPDRWLDYGAAYALAFFDMLELPPMGDLDGDLDLSGAVDIFDLNMVLIDWGKAAPNLSDPRSDGNGDGTVDIIDLNMVLIDWGKVPQEELIVVNGSPSGVYPDGADVPVSADLPGPNGSFDQWVGDTTYVADTYAPNTTVTMDDGLIIITATYAYPTYSLTVLSGFGSGTYTLGETCIIYADHTLGAAPFDGWVGDTAGVADVSSSGTVFTMGPADATITATYDTAGMLPISADGYLRHSQYAGWYLDANQYVLQFPVDYLPENRYYDLDEFAWCYTSVGPGYNGALYFDQNNPTAPAGTWNAGYEFAPYLARPYFTFDITALSGTVSSATLHLYQGGYGQGDGATVSGKCYVLDTDPVEGQANWKYSSTGVSWATRGGDYDANNYTTWTINKVNSPRAAPVDIEVGSLVQSAVTAGKSKITLLMIMDGDATPLLDDDDVLLSFFAHEGATGSWTGKKPVLYVQLSP